MLFSIGFIILSSAKYNSRLYFLIKIKIVFSNLGLYLASYETNSISNLNQYYITGKINEKEYLILLNTGQEENYIAKYLVKNEEIKTNNDMCPDLPRSLINNKNIAEKEIILGVRKIKIEFEVKEEMQKADIILGIKWLEQVKPYNIEHTQLTLTYNKE